MASFPVAEIVYQQEHLGEDESPRLATFFIICMVLSLSFVALRLASRLEMRLCLQADDYTILIGAVKVLPQIND